MAKGRGNEVGLHFVGTVFRMVASAGSGIYLGRLMGPSDQGLVSYAFWLAVTVAALASAAAGQTLIRFGLSKEGSLDLGIARLLYLTALGLSSLLSIAVFILSPSLFPSGVSPVFLSGIVGLCWAAAASQFELAALRSENLFTTASYLNLLYAGILLAGLTPAIALFGVNGCLFVFMLAELPAALRSLRFLRPDSLTVRAHHGPMVKFFVLAEISATVTLLTWGQSELLFLKRAVSAEELGYYTQALRFSLIPAQLLAFQLTYVYPLLVRLQKTGRSSEAIRCYRAGTRLYLFTLGSGSFLLSSTAQWWFSRVFGSEYAAGTHIAEILFLVAIAAVVAYSAPMAMSLGHSWLSSLSNGVAFLIVVAGNMWFAPMYGAVGTGVVRGMALIAAGLIELIAISVWIRDAKVLFDVVVTLAGIGFLAAVLHHVKLAAPHVSGIASLGLTLVIAGGTWLAFRQDILWILHSVRNQGSLNQGH